MMITGKKCVKVSCYLKTKTKKKRNVQKLFLNKHFFYLIMIDIIGDINDLVNPYNVAVSRIVSDVFASDAP